MARIGYARVSTIDQKAQSQRDALERAGCSRVFTDQGVSGKLASRPQLDACLAYLRDGEDTLVAVKLDRLGRSLRNLIDLIEGLAARDIGLVVLDQGIDTTTAAGRMFFHIVAAFAEFERDLISERTKAGLAATRARGRKGGRKDKLTPAQAAHVRELYAAKTHTIAEIGALVGVSRPTVYRYVSAAEDSETAG